MQHETDLYSQTYADGGSNYQDDEFANVLFMMTPGGREEERSRTNIEVMNQFVPQSGACTNDVKEKAEDNIKQRSTSSGNLWKVR